MSTRHTTTRAKVYPTPPSGLALTQVILWGDSPWTEIFSAAPNNLHITGVGLSNSLDGTGAAEIEIGIGEVGSEITIHTFRVEFRYGVNVNHKWIWFDVPLGGITQGDRVVIRTAAFTSALGVTANIVYYENLTSEHRSAASAKCLPERSSSFSVQFNPYAWTNSNWKEITPAFDDECTITSIYFQTASSSSLCAPCEIDLALGPAGTEHSRILTTKRFMHNYFGFIGRVVLPGGFPVPPYTRLSLRIRRGVSTASTSYFLFSVNYIYGTNFLS